MSEIDFPKMCLSMAHLVIVNALKIQLIEVANQFESRPGPWLDQIEEAVIADVKKIRTEGISEEDEFKIMRGTITLIEATFADIRASILTMD